ncbi:tRNA (adenosine(37)-N6)-dimethylallyltransferase MiaA [Flaviaesturariibacter flavus]|uniref:tRNA dimethylallyltransferase n=1 Tax=Flaviaesturariibacter flavus TaxID=2502780 RepID=A0A4R1BH70_9BACT|nr:tRNA (adenosine(37)-N6)-dimethylallyltransferase MiaA [Flaviaesturariibacter flavus]TCJ16569.1 tRNA (adenosine(37)-N6)-dimethylallyltransferase MiaA [Flaviaesturariibacter flavus]
MKKTVIVIAGPTAVGKTAVAIDVALAFGTEVLSADSRQCYRELNIGVARPTDEERAKVRHNFIASHSVYDNLHAASYEQYALNVTRRVFQKQDTIVVVGGTGLYIKALCEGMDAIPEIPAEIRKGLQADYEKYGLEWLQQLVAKSDPHYFASGETQNPHRLLRAMEVKQATGRSILDFHSRQPSERPFDVVKIVLDLPREELYDRINRRVLQMMADGLEAEARALLPLRKLNALQTVGYKELFEHFDGKCTLEASVNDIQTNTRHYAKRQLTWFRKEEGSAWMAPDSETVISYLKENKSLSPLRE